MKGIKAKRFLAAALTATLCLGASMTAFAAEGAVAVTAEQDATKKGSIENHSFVSYQVFIGDYNEGTLSNIQWGAGVNSGALVSALVEAGYLTNENATAADVAEMIGGYASYSDDAYAIARLVYENIAGEAGGLEGVDAGYYLVVDNGPNASGSADDYSYNLALLQVSNGTITPTVKNSVPSAEKKVKDVNDSTGVESGWQDSADYDIGDDVPFQLTGTVASNYNDYKTYYFAFHDVEESYFDFNNDVKVKVETNGKTTDITANYEVITSTTDGDTFEVVFDDLKNIPEVAAGSKIIVEYTSKLNDTANIGEQGNINTMHLEYSNNPNNTQGGDKGKTPDDTVIVFTYQAVVNKVDGNEEPLAGAGFTLYKQYDSAPAGKNALDVTEYTDYADKNYYEVKSIAAGDTTEFSFTGLDDGNYLLVETTTPAGYNSIAPMEFAVTASHVETLNYAETERGTYLLSLTGNKATGDIDIDSDQETTDTKTTITNNIVNNAGSVLPSTGGIGTTIFYVVGGLLIVAAIVLLVSKKRMDKED
jgi:fimbrial isopeptide formation D2 family protein/LPXTG-motif cell wall-anchored protein